MERLPCPANLIDTITATANGMVAPFVLAKDDPGWIADMAELAHTLDESQIIARQGMATKSYYEDYNYEEMKSAWGGGSRKMSYPAIPPLPGDGKMDIELAGEILHHIPNDVLVASWGIKEYYQLILIYIPAKNKALVRGLKRTDSAII